MKCNLRLWKGILSVMLSNCLKFDRKRFFRHKRRFQMKFLSIQIGSTELLYTDYRLCKMQLYYFWHTGFSPKTIIISAICFWNTCYANVDIFFHCKGWLVYYAIRQQNEEKCFFLQIYQSLQLWHKRHRQLVFRGNKKIRIIKRYGSRVLKGSELYSSYITACQLMNEGEKLKVTKSKPSSLKSSSVCK